MLKRFTPHALRAALLLALPFAFSVARAQAPAWATAAAATPATGTNTYILATAADATGNVYVAGYFVGAATFGSTALTSAGGTDGFVAKWSGSSQSWVWARGAGGASADRATSIALSGNVVYVAGYFGGSATIGTIPVTSAGGTDGFVLRLTDTGPVAVLDWAERQGGSGDDQVTALAAAGTTVYAAGSYGGSGITFGNGVLVNAGGLDAFVARFTDSGAGATWTAAQGGGGSSTDRATALARNGNIIYAAGVFAGTAMFGITSLVSAGGSDVFLVKIVETGSSANATGALRAGGPGNDQATAVATSGANVYVTGTFPATATFGNSTITSNGISGNDDGFIAKLIDSGSTATWSWAQPIGGPFFDHANAVVASGRSVYVAGSFNGPAVFGSTTLTGFQEVFVAKLTDAGSTATYNWAVKGGAANGSDYGNALALAPPRVVVGGYYGSGPATFDAFTLPNSTPGTNVAFVASLIDPTLTGTRAAGAATALTLAPNPAHGPAALTLPPAATARAGQVLDGLGRTVRTFVMPAQAGTVLLPVGGLPAGAYVVRMGAASGRLMVE